LAATLGNKWRALKGEVGENLPSLTLNAADDELQFVGFYKVVDATGKELDRFAIRVEVPADFPKVLPRIFETGGRIPRIPDRHINPDGSCCIGVEAALYSRLGPSFSFTDFMTGPVADYFLFQVAADNGVPWPAGEARHGVPGVVDHWCRDLGVDNVSAVLRLISAAIRTKRFKKNARCPCGLRQRTRRCHFRVLQKLSKRYSIAFLQREESFLRKHC